VYIVEKGVASALRCLIVVSTHVTSISSFVCGHDFNYGCARKEERREKSSSVVWGVKANEMLLLRKRMKLPPPEWREGLLLTRFSEHPVVL
jgi:hypothetical protein